MADNRPIPPLPPGVTPSIPENAPPNPQPNQWLPPTPMPVAPTNRPPQQGLGNMALNALKAWADWRMKQVPTAEQVAQGNLPFSAGAMGGLVKNAAHPSFQMIQKYFPKVANALETNPRLMVEFLDWANLGNQVKPNMRGITGLLQKEPHVGTAANPVQVGMAFNPETVNLATLIHEPEHAFSQGLGKDLSRHYENAEDMKRALAFLGKHAENPQKTIAAYGGNLPHAMVEANAQRVARKIAPNPNIPLQYNPTIYGR